MWPRGSWVQIPSFAPYFPRSLFLGAGFFCGAWRSLVAHLLWEQGVEGSNPFAPTNETKPLWIFRHRGFSYSPAHMTKMKTPRHISSTGHNQSGKLDTQPGHRMFRVGGHTGAGSALRGVRQCILSRLSRGGIRSAQPSKKNCPTQNLGSSAFAMKFEYVDSNTYAVPQVSLPCRFSDRRELARGALTAAFHPCMHPATGVLKTAFQ